MKLQIFKSTREIDLVEGCKRQSPQAQRLLYDRYSGTMLSLCRRYIWSIAEAEDVMVTGFARIFSAIHQYEGKGSFEGWMKRIVINEALGYLRKNKTMYLETDIEAADRQPDYERAESTLEAEDLMKMIGALPPGYRTIFNLYAIEGYSHKEIGELLGINENTSKSQLSRARVYLQKKIVESERVIGEQKMQEDGK
ncbi:MAG: RNA polymerase sigma factor [Cyclobacteriaceae bacterium]|nr:RNA polymerase sigma factor [Cyclobacteriaceae bacterium]